MSANRVREIVSELDLEPHPEGGYYKRVFASDYSVLARDIRRGNGTQHSGSAENAEKTKLTATAIQYLLVGNSISSLHKIQSQELWFLGEHTSNVRVVEFMKDSRTCRERILSRGNPFLVVDSDTWFGAELVGGEGDEDARYALMCLVVTPGFDFDEWRMAESMEMVVGDPSTIAAIDRVLLQRLLQKKNEMMQSKL